MKDVLNRYQKNEDIGQAKHIMKYIFPKQFGLHNVFTHLTDRRETTHAFKDYTDREAEIASSFKDHDEKIYRRLGAAVIPLIDKMQRLHQQCSYHALINYYCSPVQESTCDTGDGLSIDRETSKVFTQNEISTISTRAFDGDSSPMSKDEDIVRHHTPQHKVTLKMYRRLTTGRCLRLRCHKEGHS
jgi:hypothetical protein